MPPYFGGGLVQVRFRVFFPCPHVLEHRDQAAHFDQRPFTERKLLDNERCFVTWSCEHYCWFALCCGVDIIQRLSNLCIASFGDSTRPQHLETMIQNNTMKQFMDIHLVNMTIESMNPYMCTCFFKITGLFK